MAKLVEEVKQIVPESKLKEGMSVSFFDVMELRWKEKEEESNE